MERDSPQTPRSSTSEEATNGQLTPDFDEAAMSKPQSHSAQGEEGGDAGSDPEQPDHDPPAAGGSRGDCFDEAEEERIVPAAVSESVTHAIVPESIELLDRAAEPEAVEVAGMHPETNFITHLSEDEDQKEEPSVRKASSAGDVAEVEELEKEGVGRDILSEARCVDEEQDTSGQQSTFQPKPLECEVEFSNHAPNPSWEHFSDSDSDDCWHVGDGDEEDEEDVNGLGGMVGTGGVQFSRRYSKPESTQDELDAIQCPICLGSLCEPLRLGCAHAFCRLCVISWTETTREDGRSCPLCRSEIDIEDPFSAPVDKDLDSEVQRLLSVEDYQGSLCNSIRQTNQLKEAKASARLPIVLAPPNRRRQWHGPRVQGEMAELPLFLREPPIAVGERVELDLRSLSERVIAQRLHSAPQLLLAAHPDPYPPARGVVVLVERCRPLARGVGVKLTARGLEEGTIQMVRREMAGTVEVPYARLLVRNEQARAVISAFRSYLWAHDTPPGIIDMLEDERRVLSCLPPQCGRCTVS